MILLLLICHQSAEDILRKYSLLLGYFGVSLGNSGMENLDFSSR